MAYIGKKSNSITKRTVDNTTARFTGSGTTGPFALSKAIGDAEVDVWVGGAWQSPAAYSISGLNLTMSEAVPTGVSVVVKLRYDPVGVPVPKPGGVTSTEIAADSITPSHFADGTANYLINYNGSGVPGEIDPSTIYSPADRDRIMNNSWRIAENSGQALYNMVDGVSDDYQDADNVLKNDNNVFGAVTFDGTNDYLAKGSGLTAAVDSYQGTISFWVKFNGGDGIRQGFQSGDSGYSTLEKTTGNKIQLKLDSVGASSSFTIPSSTSITADATWHHVLISWDTNFASGSKIAHLYLDDVDDLGTVTDANAAFAVDWTRTNWGIGTSQATGNDKLNADLAEFWFSSDTYFDLSVEANRRLFIDGNGDPVHLGNYGDIPTGSPPIVYLSDVDHTNWHVNKGYGGGFAETGALTDGSAITNPAQIGSTLLDSETGYLHNGGGHFDMVTFDGTNDYLLRGADLTGSADGTQGTISCWVNFNGGDGASQNIIENSNGFIYIVRNSSNKFVIDANTSAPSAVVSMTSATSFTVSSGLIHVLMSWDTTAGVAHMYINDVDEDTTPTVSAGTIDYVRGNWGIGGGVTAGANKLNGDLGELWFSLDTYMNLDDVRNRRKFIDENGDPVYLGANGELPTGTSPIVYCSGNEDVFITNKGTGGGFTENGALTDGTDIDPTPKNITVISETFTADSQADEAYVAIRHEAIDSVTLNTDFIVDVSRDGGTTWTAATLVDEGQITTDSSTGTHKILTDTVDISGQPAGTSMKYKLVTANAKEQKIHSVALQWK